MADLPILYSFRRCPYAMRARMAVASSAITIELREVVLRDKPPELTEASSKATVPVLVLPDGKVIDESLDIMRWALGQKDPEGWSATSMSELIEQNDGPFKTALDRYKYPHRYGLDDRHRHRDDGLAFLADLDNKLRGSAFLAGHARGFSDIAIFPFVRQFAATNQNWFDAQPMPHLQSWLGRLVLSELFTSIMHRYPRWQAGDTPTLFS